MSGSDGVFSSSFGWSGVDASPVSLFSFEPDVSPSLGLSGSDGVLPSSSFGWSGVDGSPVSLFSFEPDVSSSLGLSDSDGVLSSSFGWSGMDDSPVLLCSFKSDVSSSLELSGFDGVSVLSLFNTPSFTDSSFSLKFNLSADNSLFIVLSFLTLVSKSSLTSML